VRLLLLLLLLLSSLTVSDECVVATAPFTQFQETCRDALWLRGWR
jgi:hypothetical protein